MEEGESSQHQTGVQAPPAEIERRPEAPHAVAGSELPIAPRPWYVSMIRDTMSSPPPVAPEAAEIQTPPPPYSAIANSLLALYFCWEYPIFASLSKEHFLKDFNDGNPRYCSSMLVNALLSLGCRFSRKPNTLGDPVDPNTSGDHFFKESLRLYNEERDHRRLTTIQALGIMAIREAG